MVSCVLQGGMCNTAFTTMAVLAYAKKHNMPYAIPTKTSNPRWKHYRFGSVHHEDVNTKGFYHYKSPDIFYDNRPYDVSYHEIPYHENIILEGHFQSWKYWIDYIDEIRDIFNFPYEFKEGTISVHKRLGDYLTMPDKLPPVSPSYIANAINHFTDMGYLDFIAFSDDPISFRNEARSLFLNGSIHKSLHIKFAEGNTDMQDLALMSSCAHNIIANSSYSLLAYYLNRNPNKQCICPRIWTGPAYGIVNWDMVYPPGALVL